MQKLENKTSITNMNLGDKLIQFELEDEEEQSIAPYRMFSTYDGILMIFYSSFCAYSQAYFQRFQQIIDDYKPDSLGILFVNVLNGDQEESEESELDLFEKAQQHKAFIKLVKDEGQQLAGAMEVEVTPKAFLFDGNQKLVYKGPIDDSPESAEKVNAPYLRNALDQALNGQDVTTPDVAPEGTPVTYSSDEAEAS